MLLSQYNICTLDAVVLIQKTVFTSKDQLSIGVCASVILKTVECQQVLSKRA